MKNTTILILMLFTFMNCNSQKFAKPVEQKTSFQNINELKGNWFNTKTSTNKNNISNNLVMECAGKSFWEISESDGHLNLIKHYASGKNCETHTIKTNGLSYDGGAISYREGDIMKSEKLEKINDTKFKTAETGLSNGQSILIERFYEKK